MKPCCSQDFPDMDDKTECSINLSLKKMVGTLAWKDRVFRKKYGIILSLGFLCNLSCPWNMFGIFLKHEDNSKTT